MLYIVWSHTAVIMNNVKQTDKVSYSYCRLGNWSAAPSKHKLVPSGAGFLLRNVRVWLQNGTVTVFCSKGIIKSKIEAKKQMKSEIVSMMTRLLR